MATQPAALKDDTAYSNIDIDEILASDDKDPEDVTEVSPETMNELEIEECVALLACIYNTLVKHTMEVLTVSHNKLKGNPSAP